MSENDFKEVNSVEILRNEAAISPALRVEIDSQVATAKMYPRTISVFRKRVLDVATVNQRVAVSCNYSLPRADKELTGPSIRLAEIVAANWQNLRAGMRVIANDGKKITAQGICHDLENNVCVTLEVSRSILQNVYENGRPTGAKVTMSEDMQVVTGNAACAIAFRNVVFKVVPAALVQDIMEEIKKVAIGDALTLPERRAEAVQFLNNLGITNIQITTALNIPSTEDIGLEKMFTLGSMVASYKNGEARLDELFPKVDLRPPAAGAKMNESVLGMLKEQGKKKSGRPPKAPDNPPAPGAPPPAAQAPGVNEEIGPE